MLHASGTELSRKYGRDIFGGIGGIGVNAGSVGIEIIIRGCARFRFYGSRYLFVAGGSDISVELYVVVLIGNKSETRRLFGEYVSVGFYHAARFSAESTRTRNDVGSLHRNHDRFVGVAEVIVFDEYARTHCCSYAIFGTTVHIVVVDVAGIRTYTRVAAVAMVVPVMVVGDVHLVVFSAES